MERKSFGLPIKEHIDLQALPQAWIDRIPYSFAKKHQLLVIEEAQGTLIAAISDPLNLQALDELRLMLGVSVQAVIVSESLILEAIHAAYHKEGATGAFISHLKEETRASLPASEEQRDLLDERVDAPIVRLLNLILSEAIAQRASDIHFEPFEEDLRIRYRIDGVLQLRHLPARQHQAELLSRIKVLAKLDIAEHRLPQDGRIKVRMGAKSIDLRVSTIPSSYGERIVLRILDQAGLKMHLDEIGMLPATTERFKALLDHSEGMILVTGPTGSGKTTTLYSALIFKYSDEINVMTIEDPIEYKLKGIGQIAVHPKIGLTFAQGLRHILRQDPDVVMIGEIRDRETAEIAIQAAMTGHLVLSTLHTNDAPGAIVRLVDMGIEPYLISSTLIGVLAQRLVRKICPFCIEEYAPQKGEHVELALPENAPLYRGRGCPHCLHSGYLGRMGIYELMVIDEEIKKRIATCPEAGGLRTLAMQKGMISLRRQGALLVAAGQTTVNEVWRVSRREVIDASL